jgi:hypothetical protein
VAYSTYILIMLLVPLKIYCRKRSGGWRNVRLDDYMTIVALAMANGFFYTCIIGMSITILPSLPFTGFERQDSNEQQECANP